MSDDMKRLRKALAKIAEVASEAVNGEVPDGGDQDDDRAEDSLTKDRGVCIPKLVPKSMLVKAAKNAVGINPFNQPEYGSLHMAAPGLEVTELFIAAVTAKYWGSNPRTLTVSFMESTATDLRRRIVSHLNAWTRTGCVQFSETSGVGQVRISRGSGGYYSYLGTDILVIPRNRQTMNLEGFTMNTPESEYKRVIRHEAGHTLGFPHEHMRKTLVLRIDPEKAYDYFRRTQGWSRTQVDQQVLTSLDERTLMATPADQTSIMCYQLPGSITRNGQPILGGLDINQSDYDFVGQIYPKPGQQFTNGSDDLDTEDWECEDAEEFG
ncbi:MAG: M12 family metallopeptidase [Isosphaeraceae bacterium]